MIPVIDMRNLKVDEKKDVEVWDGVAVRGKIESYSNAGIIEDPETGEKTKTVIMSISVVIPASDVLRFQMIEDEDSCVQMLIQPTEVGLNVQDGR